MTEKKDPNERNVPDDLFDEEPIIDLTDEVKIEPDAEGKISSSKSDDLSPPNADKYPETEDDENIIIFEEKTNSLFQSNSSSEPNRQIAGDDERIDWTDKFEPDSRDDEDLFIMVDDQDSVDGDSTAMIDDDAIEMSGNDLGNQFDGDMELEYEIDEGEIDFFSDDDERVEDNEVISMASDLSDIDLEHEAGDEITPMPELENDEADAVDDIIEITEFDQHYADDDESLERAEFLDPSGLKDEDFLELFDIEDEGLEEDEEMKELSASEEKNAEAELSQFFDDVLEEDQADLENKASLPGEKFSELDTDLAKTAAALSASAGKFDRTDTLLPQDPNREKDAYMQKNSPASNAEDHPVISTEQIDQAIERIINEKLAGRIEHIIYEIIEKSVKREIDRLKESLFEDSPPEDDI